jgi:threonine dehydratase
MQTVIDRDDIRSAHGTIAPYIRRTPVLTVDPADFGVAAAGLDLKLEFLQYAGSFKARGAFANMLLRQVPAAGVVAASGGNHGVAVALAAQRLRIKATIFVPTVAAQAKQALIRASGAELVVGGDLYADALQASEAHVRATGALAVHAFDQPETLMGQGTLGLEWSEQCPRMDTLLVAVGGGGLIGGIAAWFRGDVRIVGVEPELAPTLHDAMRAGRPVDAPAGGIAADSLAPRRVGELMFPIAQQFIERVLLVPDSAIAAAQRLLWERLRIVAEPGGATAMAALASGAYVPASGERVGVLVCGANTDVVRFG